MLKVLPFLIMLGGGVAVSKHAGPFVDVVLNKVKILVTGMELAKIGDELRFKFLDSGTVPGLDYEDDFSDFLRENFKPYWGSRDPSTDLWLNDYRLVPGLDELEAVIFSYGPNGEEDECAVLDGAKVALEINVERITEEEMQAYLEQNDLTGLPDDLCISLEFALRDTPFRSLNELE